MRDDVVLSATGGSSTETPLTEVNRVELLGLGVVVVSLIVEVLSHALERKLERHKHLAKMLAKAYREATILGLIAFVLFVVDQVATLDPNVTHVLEVVHMTLFVVLLLYVVITIFLMGLSAWLSMHWDDLEKHDTTDYLIIKQEFDDLTDIWSKSSAWQRICNVRLRLRYEKVLEMQRYHDLRLHFIHANGLDATFSFAIYLRKCKQHVFLGLVELHWTVWACIALMIILDLLQRNLIDRQPTDLDYQVEFSIIGFLTCLMAFVCWRKCRIILRAILHSDLLDFNIFTAIHYMQAKEQQQDLTHSHHSDVEDGGSAMKRKHSLSDTIAHTLGINKENASKNGRGPVSSWLRRKQRREDEHIQRSASAFELISQYKQQIWNIQASQPRPEEDSSSDESDISEVSSMASASQASFSQTSASQASSRNRSQSFPPRGLPVDPSTLRSSPVPSPMHRVSHADTFIRSPLEDVGEGASSEEKSTPTGNSPTYSIDHTVSPETPTPPYASPAPTQLRPSPQPSPTRLRAASEPRKLRVDIPDDGMPYTITHVPSSASSSRSLSRLQCVDHGTPQPSLNREALTLHRESISSKSRMSGRRNSLPTHRLAEPVEVESDQEDNHSTVGSLRRSYSEASNVLSSRNRPKRRSSVSISGMRPSMLLNKDTLQKNMSDMSIHLDQEQRNATRDTNNYSEDGEQADLFWFGSHRFLLTLVQALTFGSALFLALVVQLFDPLFHTWWSAFMVLIPIPVVVLFVSLLLPTYTIIVHVGQLADPVLVESAKAKAEYIAKARMRKAQEESQEDERRMRMHRSMTRQLGLHEEFGHIQNVQEENLSRMERSRIRAGYFMFGNPESIPGNLSDERRVISQMSLQNTKITPVGWTIVFNMLLVTCTYVEEAEHELGMRALLISILVTDVMMLIDLALRGFGLGLPLFLDRWVFLDLLVTLLMSACGFVSLFHKEVRVGSFLIILRLMLLNHAFRRGLRLNVRFACQRDVARRLTLTTSGGVKLKIMMLPGDLHQDSDNLSDSDSEYEPSATDLRSYHPPVRLRQYAARNNTTTAIVPRSQSDMDLSAFQSAPTQRRRPTRRPQPLEIAVEHPETRV